MNNSARLPASPIERHAEALAELQELHASHAELVRRVEEDRRTIDRLEDRCSMLIADLRTAQNETKVVTRKLIRLAANQRNMARLAADGDEIMRSVAEWEDETPEKAAEEQESAREMVSKLPPNPL